MTVDRIDDIAAQVRQQSQSYSQRVFVCCGAGCLSSGSDEVLNQSRKAVETRGLQRAIGVFPTGCMGPCNQGPLVRMAPRDTIYEKVQPDEADALIEKHCVLNQIAESKLLFTSSGEPGFERASDYPFFKLQQRVALENVGVINPESLEEYIAAGGTASWPRDAFESLLDYLAENGVPE